MVPHTPPPPFIPHMQRLRCQAKVKAKALKPHTPGCGACTDIDVMLAVGVFESRVSRLAFAKKTKNKKQKEFRSPERRHPAPTHAQFLFLHFDIMAIIWEAVVFLLRSQSSEPHYRTLTRPGTSPSFSGSVLISTPASQGLFFLFFSPPSTPSHPLFPKIASHIWNRQRSRRGGRPSFSFPSLSLSMCFCSLYLTVSHPQSSPCNWFYISDKQSTALKRSCLCARRSAWIVITLCTEWAWGLFGL